MIRAVRCDTEAHVCEEMGTEVARDNLEKGCLTTQKTLNYKWHGEGVKIVKT